MARTVVKVEIVSRLNGRLIKTETLDISKPDDEKWLAKKLIAVASSNMLEIKIKGVKPNGW